MTMEWIEVGQVEDIPVLGSRLVNTQKGQIALFRAKDGAVFALHNRCPHRNGPLSEGIVHDHKVTCPLHNWVIDLESGHAQAPDNGCTPTVPVKIEGKAVYLQIPAVLKVAHG